MKDHMRASINPTGNNTIQSLKTRADGHMAHYLKAGSGPPVVLLHGGASDSEDWVETMTVLADSYTVYAPDMLGYGSSDRAKSSYYLSEFVEFTLAFFREMNLEHHYLVGHSIGGRICLEIALRHPELVRRLVLIDTMGFGKLTRRGIYMGAFMYYLRKMLRIEQPYPRFLKADGEDRDWRCNERLSELEMPTLVIWNSRDPYYPVAQALRAKEQIPLGRLEIFSGYGHAPHVKNRGYFNSLLLDFLKHD
jgi:pimeloyl-ACP methyl ester carboxylesterase